MKTKSRPIYRTHIYSLEELLKHCFVDGFHADKVLQHAFKSNPRWGSKDRKFIAENFYDIVRNWRKLYEITGEPWIDPPNTEMSNLLFKGVVCAWLMCHYSAEELPEDIYSNVDSEKLKSQWKTKGSLEYEVSFPNWIVKRIQEVYTDQAREILDQLNEKAPVYLRVNQQKTSSDELVESLKENDIRSHSVNDQTVILDQRGNVFQSMAFKNGLFEVQDIGSQEIAKFLNPQMGERVLDACAGAGGKALHMADLMKNKGKILASDIHEWKLKELRKRSSRNGYDLIEAKVLNPKQIKRLKESFDGVLLDVPCSGLGVIRRNPDTKWKLTPERVLELQQIQQSLLELYSSTVKPGGRMVYATCSILPEENREQVDQFLKQHAEFKLKEDRVILPGRGDGFYMALLTRD
ncbi:MAG: methyltransferase domain-containing protein [Bdellovibrionales bacterium]|nr:methyltransferase domain-containing protein [Bdellovibrionales bacterium]